MSTTDREHTPDVGALLTSRSIPSGEAGAILAIASQPHRRYNPLKDEWVLVSAGRNRRPWLGAEEPESVDVGADYDPDCYLCPGNVRANGHVNPVYDTTFEFTNDYPALQPDASPLGFAEGLLRSEVERGTCRVVCYSPRHDLTLGNMPPDAVSRVIDLWADQTEELGRRYQWIQVFENRGKEMGASNPHPHGQIWAGAALPNEGAREDAAQRRHLAATHRRLLLDYLDQEHGGDRVVDESREWLVLVPYWAAWPFETLVIPKRPAARLAHLDSRSRQDLVRLLHDLSARYDRLFRRPCPFSMGWHQAPFIHGSSDAWQVHAHFYPPLLTTGVRKFMVGYELLSEPQRDLTPEEAASRLRSVRPQRKSM